MNLEAVYEKYKHLDPLLSDPEWLGSEFRWLCLGDLWAAVKNAVLTSAATRPPSSAPRRVAQDQLGSG